MKYNIELDYNEPYIIRIALENLKRGLKFRMLWNWKMRRDYGYKLMLKYIDDILRKLPC